MKAFDDLKIPEPGLWPSHLPKGLLFQLYEDSYSSESAMIKAMQTVKELGARVAIHTWPRRSIRKLSRYLKLFSDTGLEPCFAWGLDSSRDDDGTILTAKEKGECIGTVLKAVHESGVAHPIGIEDEEIQWDEDSGPSDESDEQGALDLGSTAKGLCPSAILITQDWPIIGGHSDERPTPKPIEQGGTTSGYPSDELAVLRSAKAPQGYWENFPERGYCRFMQWHESQWEAHEKSLARLGLVLPRTVTIQCYGESRETQPWWLMHALCRYSDRLLVLWTNGSAKAKYNWNSTLNVIRDWQELTRQGYTGRRAVLDFQRYIRESYDPEFAIDDYFGPATRSRLWGIEPR